MATQTSAPPLPLLLQNYHQHQRFAPPPHPPPHPQQLHVQRPLSPALSNPDLILPDSEPGSSSSSSGDDELLLLSPQYAPERPPSPSQLLRKVHSQARVGAAGAHTLQRLNWQVQEPTAAQQQQQQSQALFYSSGSSNGNSSSHTLRLDININNRTTPAATTTPPLSRKGSNLEDYAEDDATPTRTHFVRDGVPLAASTSQVTLKDGNALPANGAPQAVWQKPELDRRWSEEASSVHSDEFESLESLKWPGFDSAAGVDIDEDEVDDVILDDEEEERFGSLPELKENSVERARETTSGVDGDDEGDAYSPDALSRRADVILANAKRRLNLFEGNLRGARHSLPISQSLSMTSLRDPPNIPPLPTPPRERSKYSGLAGPLSPGVGEGGGGGHHRVFSDASASSFIQQLMAARASKTQALPLRSASALATHTAANLLRSTRSQEIMKEHRVRSWIHDAQASLASPTSSTAARSEPPSRARASIRRSPSTTNDLRAQMNELKGKISSLQQRAREEGERRQERESHSPFTDSEAPYHHVGGYGNRATPNGVVARRSPLGTQQYSAVDDDDVRDDMHAMDDGFEGSEYESAEELFDVEDDDIRDEEEQLRHLMGPSFPYASTPDDEGDSVYESADEDSPMQVAAERHEDRPDAFDYENFFLHSAMGSYSRSGRRDSMSSSASVETTKPASAFKHTKSDSSATDSPVDEQQGDEDQEEQEEGIEVDGALQPPDMHKRSTSAASVSTLATFTTATEGDDDEESDNDNDLANLIEITPPPLQPQRAPSPSRLSAPSPTNSSSNSPVISQPSPTPPAQPHSSSSSSSLRDSGVALSPPLRRIPPSPLASPPLALHSPPPSASPPVPFAADNDDDDDDDAVDEGEDALLRLLLHSSRASNAEGGKGGGEVLAQLQPRDRELLGALARSVEKACAGLRDVGASGGYEGKVWRRRLDEARRVLDGVDGEEKGDVVV